MISYEWYHSRTSITTINHQNFGNWDETRNIFTTTTTVAAFDHHQNPTSFPLYPSVDPMLLFCSTLSPTTTTLLLLLGIAIMPATKLSCACFNCSGLKLHGTWCLRSFDLVWAEVSATKTHWTFIFFQTYPEGEPLHILPAKAVMRLINVSIYAIFKHIKLQFHNP